VSGPASLVRTSPPSEGLTLATAHVTPSPSVGSSVEGDSGCSGVVGNPSTAYRLTPRGEAVGQLVEREVVDHPASVRHPRTEPPG